MSTLESYGGSWIISMEKEHELYLRKVKRDKWKVRAIRILILVAFIALWEIAAQLKWIDPFLTSSPSRIIKSLVSFINEGTLFRHIWVTCYETIIGFTLGTVLGVAIAILLWASKTASKVFRSLFSSIKCITKSSTCSNNNILGWQWYISNYYNCIINIDCYNYNKCFNWF